MESGGIPRIAPSVSLGLRRGEVGRHHLVRRLGLCRWTMWWSSHRWVLCGPCLGIEEEDDDEQLEGELVALSSRHPHIGIELASRVCKNAMLHEAARTTLRLICTSDLVFQHLGPSRRETVTPSSSAQEIRYGNRHNLTGRYMESLARL